MGLSFSLMVKAHLKWFCESTHCFPGGSFLLPHGILVNSFRMVGQETEEKESRNGSFLVVQMDVLGTLSQTNF